MPKLIALIALILSQHLLAAPARAADRVCTPRIGWSDVPPEIRAQIVQAVGGAVSPQGGPFNAVDFGSRDVPRTRFFGACSQAPTWEIAVERGGRWYRLQIFKFSGHTLTGQWTRVFSRPGDFTPDLLIPPAQP
jgi:hypothetical protein